MMSRRGRFLGKIEMLFEQVNRHVVLSCDVCKSLFNVLLSRYKRKKRLEDYCSEKCRKSVTNIQRECQYCGTFFIVFASSLKRSKTSGSFCSKHCLNQAQKKGGIICQKYERSVMKKFGVNRPAKSLIVKENIKKSVRWKNSLFQKDNTPWNKGLKVETSEKLCAWIEKAKINNPVYKPKGSPEKEQWRSNISLSAKLSYREGRRTSSFSRMSREEKINLHRKIAKILAAKGYANKGFYMSSKSGNSYHYDSSWELERMRQLDQDNNIVNWSRSQYALDYMDTRGKTRCYIPDFDIVYHNKNVVEEVKGIVNDNFIQKYNAAIEFFTARDIEYRVTFRNMPGQFITLTHDNIIDINKGDKTLKEILGVFKSH